MPEGPNVEWIPGYWQWEADNNQFIWVSGVYRDVPPGQRWVQGYWTQTDNGWQWVHGFWAPAGQQELDYLPPPPPPRQEEPSASPGEDYFYIPGCWVYQQSQYAWRPGYWWQAQPDWVYVPPQYQWTPGGCVFTDGYWDYPLSNRGLLFAPVAFTQPRWNNPDWYYQPQYVVGPTPLLNSLWVRPNWGCYYFGNYYAPGYAGAGFRPWHDYGARYHDPLFSYYRWRNRSNPLWAANLRNVYRDRVAGRAPLPPDTLRQQVALARNGGRGFITNNRAANRIAVTRNSTQMLAPLDQAARLPGANVRLARVNAARVQQMRTNAQGVHAFASQRHSIETANARVLARSPRNAAADRGSLTPLRLPAHPNAVGTGNVNRGPIRAGQGAVTGPARNAATRPEPNRVNPGRVEQPAIVRTPIPERQGNVNGGVSRNFTPDRKNLTVPRVSANPNAARQDNVNRVPARSGPGAVTRPARNGAAPAAQRQANVNGGEKRLPRNYPSPSYVPPNVPPTRFMGANRNPAAANRAATANARTPAGPAARSRMPSAPPRSMPSAVNRYPQVRQPAPRMQQPRAQQVARPTSAPRRVQPAARPAPRPSPQAARPAPRAAPARTPPAQHTASTGRNRNHH
jgi:hypothetical protein